MSIRSKLYKRAKFRAKKRGLTFTIEPEHITIPSFCPILGIPLKVNVGHVGGLYNSPTLDRKNNSYGYTPDNIWVISQLANQMKSSATPAQLLLFRDWIDREYGGA